MADRVGRDVLVAVPTYRRVELLPALLEEIRRQSSQLAADDRVRIVVVDNDPAQSARAALPPGVQYLPEPAPGIAAVRQRALDHAVAGELAVMIDDDVFPEPGWLMNLLNSYERHRPTAVLGYVRYVWPADADPWIVAGGFMRRTAHRDGTRLDTFVTGNVLIDVDAVRAAGVSFDVSLGLSGGEDTRFGQDILAAGGTIVAASESVCRDDVPVDRLTRAFVRTRTISHGEIRVRVDLHGTHGARRTLGRIGSFAGGLLRWAVFAARHLLGRVIGDIALDAVGQRRAWFAIGRMRGALGRWGAEYAREQEASAHG